MPTSKFEGVMDKSLWTRD